MLDQSNILIDVHVHTDPDRVKQEIRNGLLSSPKKLPTKYFYDDRGSALFEQICELPEYYPARTEFQLLKNTADDVVAQTGADTLVELGSGAATKTRVLFDAMSRAKQLRLYVPFDVSEGIVRRVAQELVEEYQGLQVHGIVGDFLAHLEHIPEGGKRLVAFLGGTIGNLGPEEALAFLSSIYEEMGHGDFFLLGVQLTTDVNRLEAAYNDSAGITETFNKNILSVLQSVIGAEFDLDAFEHIARFNHEQHRIEIYLRSRRDQAIPIPELDLHLRLHEGEEILTEISTKYTRPQVETLLTGAGFSPVEWYTDPDHLHGLALAKKR
ncbi:L-histidine N(alpha)-methyltransferase [Candidatus Nitronereus thalassa]|uniref:L-histidine N(Alpha)-methyltransferase n=1 Tax=Candidatus Nitronereus thalassa TaxID=3020898 RepID=A0ABU3K750_9BACT|nr:L-histidine N(alpha)-methyltransferase [Candidatus Nitronereus thalassa]MDT7042252.1 L-histidine N(alpha)-methyltransferase [Candidatus Nitronereus thalassa]